MASEQMIQEHSEEEAFETTSCIIKQHLNFIKCFGAMCIALIVILTVVIFSTVDTTRYTVKHSIPVKPKNVNVCHFVKQFDLLGGLNMTVCNIEGNIVLDDRDNKSCDISMELQQWLRVKQIMPLIDTAIQEARRYWINLQQLHPKDKK